MDNRLPIRIKTITEFHRMWNLPMPEHPLISLVDYSSIDHSLVAPGQTTILEFYSITNKCDLSVKINYGQQSVDFDGGILFFMAPNQMLSIDRNPENTRNQSGWILLIHPDFLWHTALAKNIKRYDFFHYAIHEALFLSEKEEQTITGIVTGIRQEYSSNIDNFSQNIIISQLETLLNYSERFYQRQFITRKTVHHKMLDRLEDFLDDYFQDRGLSSNGLPNVKQIAAHLNVSASYLSAMLKLLTGYSTQQHIQQKVIDKAKERLSTSNMSVAEIAYELGFEHPQSFNKLFKLKTKMSPLEFRASLN